MNTSSIHVPSAFHGFCTPGDNTSVTDFANDLTPLYDAELLVDTTPYHDATYALLDHLDIRLHDVGIDTIDVMHNLSESIRGNNLDVHKEDNVIDYMLNATDKYDTVTVVDSLEGPGARAPFGQTILQFS